MWAIESRSYSTVGLNSALKILPRQNGVATAGGETLPLGYYANPVVETKTNPTRVWNYRQSRSVSPRDSKGPKAKSRD